MRKIPTIFRRDPDCMSSLLDDPHPDCLWVFDGEGVATRKYDGTCVAILGRQYLKRREIKKGKKAPEDFIELMIDPNTGKRVGWVPVKANDPNDKWHMVAFDRQPDGTYELCGPKIQGNPEGFEEHVLVSHAAAEEYPDFPRFVENFSTTKEKMVEWLQGKDIEGIVFHGPNGQMGKIKKRDFGLKR